jgi:hypothetical protein
LNKDLLINKKYNQFYSFKIQRLTKFKCTIQNADMRYATLVIWLVFSFASLSAQVIVKSKSPEELVSQMLIGQDAGVAVFNVSYYGSDKSIGAFYSAIENLPVKRGLVLSTGIAEQIDGPNIEGNNGTVRFTPGIGGKTKSTLVNKY